MLLRISSVFSVHLLHAHNLLIGDVTTSDPFVYLHGEWSEDVINSKRRPSQSRSGKGQADGQQAALCCYHSKVIKRNLNPVWDERCLAAGVTCNDRIVLTIMDKDTFSKDDCLGQVMSHPYPRQFFFVVL